MFLLEWDMSTDTFLLWCRNLWLIFHFSIQKLEICKFKLENYKFKFFAIEKIIKRIYYFWIYVCILYNSLWILTMFSNIKTCLKWKPKLLYYENWLHYSWARLLCITPAKRYYHLRFFNLPGLQKPGRNRFSDKFCWVI